MFTPGRYIVIDDEADQLQMLIEALHGLGAPCVGVHYTGHELDPTIFAGVRLLFCDLNLLPGGSPGHQQYGIVQSLLETYVNPAVGGPYVLILWTKHEEELVQVRAFLEARLPSEKKPLAVLALDKTLYIVDGKLTNTEGLKTEIRERISESPQLRALMSWEADVLTAAGTTLAEIAQLARLGDEADGLGAKLDGVLSRLAVAAVGTQNVERDRRGAINAALAPILADRIMNAPTRPENQEVWTVAITRQSHLPDIDNEQTGRINRLLHLSVPPAEQINATDWGAVLLLPEEERIEAAMLARFGVKYPELLSQVFHVEREDRSRCTPVLVRIGAVCDYAQRRLGPILYVLGLLVPAEIKRKDQPPPKAELESPVFVIDTAHGPVRLYSNARFQISMVQPPLEWTPLFRIREQALMLIAAHVAEYVTRPGMVKLPQ